MYKSSKLTIYSDLDYIDGVVCYLGEICKKLDLDKKETNRICYAVEESLSNTISHCADLKKDETIDIEIKSVPSGLKVVLNDFGAYYSFAKEMPQSIDTLVENLSFENILSDDRDSIDRFSNYIIHKVLDRYRCINNTDGSRSIEMTVYCAKERVESGEIDSLAKDEIFDSMRFANDKDAKSISALFQKKYGYAYPNEVVFYPKRLQELFKGLSLISVVGISNRGNVIAHAALLRPYRGSRITEFGLLIGDKGFDNYEMILKLSERILQVAFSSSYYGLFFHPILNVEFSQKLCRAYSFHDVALLVGYWRQEESNQRASTTISFKLLRDIGETKLCLPSKHEKMIRKLYGNLGIKIKSRFYEVNEVVNRSTIVDSISSALHSAEIVVKQAGVDLVEQIFIRTKELRNANIDVIYLYLDLKDKNSISRIDELEKMGYFFVGIFPFYHHKHSIVLEYVNNIEFDYDSISTQSLMAEELKNYICKLDPNQKENVQ
jgi:anti-sigma regulatory factor (Ser/Thr protein kinase)